MKLTKRKSRFGEMNGPLPKMRGFHTKQREHVKQEMPPRKEKDSK